MTDYRDILRAEGHDVQGGRCRKCWNDAFVRALSGGDRYEHYGALLVESKERAMEKARVAG